MNRYLVVYWGGNPSPWAQFVSASGTLQGDRIPIGGGYYNGWGPDVAWNSSTKEYLVTWGHGATEANYARRISQTGAYLGETFRTNGNVMGFGNWCPIVRYNSANNDYLICWFWQYDNVYVRRYRPCPLPPTDTQPPGPVTNLTLSRTPSSMNLSWTNPSTADFAGTMIRSKVGSPPSGPSDGKLVVDQPNCPGTVANFTDTSEPRGTLLCYAAFAHDAVLNYATAATACGMLVAGDFDGDNDVDQEDFGYLQACLSDSAGSTVPGCQQADFDIDNDVDQDEVAAFISCKTGPGQAPGC